ncbi:DUF58 domain-containing protein [Candidatus Woesearchaeota archaeon]|nr:DUF58 domain-containing protein [Candidatus Woesearchaeota archaeon]
MAIDTAFLQTLDTFSLIVNKRVTSNYVGERKSLFFGRGLTFKDHRIYVPGDDIRLVDWKVYARTDDLYIKRFEEERNLSVHILVDDSASMNFGSPATKYEYASMLGIGFAYLALKSNEKFQFATFADRLDLFTPRRGMHQLASMVQHLNTAKPRGVTKFSETVAQYRKLVNSRSFITIMSDFLFPIEDIEKGLYLIADGHDMKVVQVLDRVERDMALQGDLRLKDSESSSMLRTFISQRLRSNYQNMLEEHIAKVQKLCNQLGIEFYSITTDTPLFDAFFEMLKE